MVRSCSPEPADPEEGPISREGEDLAEGTSPQVPKELVEEAASQKAEEPAAEAQF